MPVTHPLPASTPTRRLKWSIFLVIIATLFALMFFGPTDIDVWDPSFYYEQLRSPIIDHDLNLRGETNTRGLTTPLTITGLQGSAYPLGPGMLWSPFFLVAHWITNATQPAQADGYSYWYISLVTLGSAIFGILALLLIYRICRYFTGHGLALLATCMCLFASPLFFYIFRQPVMSHTTNLFASTGILLVYLILDEYWETSRWSGMVFGVFLGLCFLTRWSGIILAILPVIYFGSRLIQSIRRRRYAAIRAILLQLVVMVATFLVMIIPQLIFWYRLHRTLLVFPPPPTDFLVSLLPPNFINIFIHTNRGLSYWFPFALLGLIGLIFIPDRNLKIAAILYTFLLTVLLGYRKDWYGGGIFGARYYIEALPFIALGFVSMTRRFYHAPAMKASLITLTILLSAHQLMLMHAVEHAAEPGWVNMHGYMRGEPLGLSWQLDATTRLLRDPAMLFTPRPYVSPDRQTVLVNWLIGERTMQSYLIPGMVVLLTPFVATGVILLWRRTTRKALPAISLGFLALMSCWTVYLLFFTS
jgi:hypothetical protein